MTRGVPSSRHGLASPGLGSDLHLPSEKRLSGDPAARLHRRFGDGSCAKLAAFLDGR